MYKYTTSIKYPHGHAVTLGVEVWRCGGPSGVYVGTGWGEGYDSVQMRVLVNTGGREG